MVGATVGQRLRRLVQAMVKWFDTSSPRQALLEGGSVDWLRTVPFIAMHVACLGVIWVGVSTVALVTALGLYLIRMLAITGFYHRYFSHRSFKTSRALQFFFALIGAASVQRGPIWWAAHHRHHHAFTDGPEDPHSPLRHGFWWSHTGWFLSKQHFVTHESRVRDLMKFPELRFLDRFDTLVPALLAVALYSVGEFLALGYPSLNTSGAQMLVWGFCLSTVVLYHATFTINSLAHRWGKRRYATSDDSRNNWVLALLTLGEGWHNNHHHYPVAARQGFFWWEIDLTYYFLRLLAAAGLVWDLKPVPLARRNSSRIEAGTIEGHQR
jgi:stearoyl-CoA desaturase (delta-9 desaturase)